MHRDVRKQIYFVQQRIFYLAVKMQSVRNIEQGLAGGGI